MADLRKRSGGERYKDVTQTPYFSPDYALGSFLRYAAQPEGRGHVLADFWVEENTI